MNALSIAVDPSGNAYVAGSATTPAGGPSGNTFLDKIASDGSVIVFSRVLPAGVLAIAADSMGNVTVGGYASASAFPPTSTFGQSALVARISADGSTILWSVQLGSTVTISGQTGYSQVQSLALDSSGNVYLTGVAPVPVPTVPGALQPTFTNPFFNNAFFAELSSDGTKLLAATNLSGHNGATLNGVVLDPSGNPWITGNTSSADFPGLTNPSSSSLDFALERLFKPGDGLHQVSCPLKTAVSAHANRRARNCAAPPGATSPENRSVKRLWASSGCG